MALTPETKLKRKVAELLSNTKGLIYIKLWGNPNQKAGWPDYLAIYKGEILCLELKKDSKEKLRPLQLYILERLERGGANVLVAYELEQVENFIKGIEEKMNE